jgi:hypothetical protein
MNAETLIRAAQNDGLRLTLTDIGAVKCVGPKQAAERWAPQLRQHKAEILVVLTAANDSELPDDLAQLEADDFWRTLRARIDECDRLIHLLCDLRADDDERRNDLLAVRKRMAPDMLDFDIAYLNGEITKLTPAAPSQEQTRGRCIECVHVARASRGERCAHPDRSPAGEPKRADCLPAHQCDRFIHWRGKQ